MKVLIHMSTVCVQEKLYKKPEIMLAKDLTGMLDSYAAEIKKLVKKTNELLGDSVASGQQPRLGPVHAQGGKMLFVAGRQLAPRLHGCGVFALQLLKPRLVARAAPAT